jgi:hypothetical protein
MKIGIILSGNIESQPYISYYTDVFDKMKIDYEYICWDRDDKNPSFYNNHRVNSIKVKGSIKNNNIRKLYDYWLFTKNVKKFLKKNDFDFLLIHTIVNAIFLKGYLLKNYAKRYIFDIRDYSPICPCVKKNLKGLIEKSLFTAVSSIGFLSWLPEGSNVVVSHNISKKNFVCDLSDKLINREPFKILTIGKIRDFESNKRVIDSLGNTTNLELVFCGAGIESYRLECYALKHYTNVAFTGSYLKENESELVKDSSLLNIMLPTNILSSTLLSNRFYLAITHKKPIIVNRESFQSIFVEKYNLGVVIEADDNIYDKIFEYMRSFDFDSFNAGCDELIEIVKMDIDIFENTIISKLS